jgi:HD domain-containing protein
MSGIDASVPEELPGPVVAAIDAVRDLIDPAILNHSLRTMHYALVMSDEVRLAEEPREALAVACVLHDVGTSPSTWRAVRFEVSGADFAVDLARSAGLHRDHFRDVWLAIALHTSAQIAEAAGEIPRLTRKGVQADFGAPLVPEATRADIEHRYPRMDIERVLSSAVVDAALVDPERAPRNSWPRSLLEAHLAHPNDPDARLRGF